MADTELTVITFEGGRTFTVPAYWHDETGAHVAGIDAMDNPVGRRDGGYFGLTLCCGATFKGLEDGIGCRSCHRVERGDDIGTDVPAYPVTPRPLAAEVGLRLLREALPRKLSDACAASLWPNVAPPEHAVVFFDGFTEAWIEVADDEDEASGARPDEDWTEISGCDLTSRASIEATVMRARFYDAIVGAEMLEEDEAGAMRLMHQSDAEVLANPVLLREQSTKDSRRVLTTWPDAPAAARYHHDQEYAGDWWIEDLLDLRDGAEWKVHTTYTATKHTRSTTT